MKHIVTETVKEVRAGFDKNKHLTNTTTRVYPNKRIALKKAASLYRVRLYFRGKHVQSCRTQIYRKGIATIEEVELMRGVWYTVTVRECTE